MAAYQIEFTEDAKTDLSFYTAFERRRITSESRLSLRERNCGLSLRERTFFPRAKTDFSGKLFASQSQRGVAATEGPGDRAPSYSYAAHQHVALYEPAPSGDPDMRASSGDCSEHGSKGRTQRSIDTHR